MMNRYYDNWEKLVEAVIKREQLRALSLDSSRSPSTRSMDSEYSYSSSSHYESEYQYHSSRSTPSPLNPETVMRKLAQSVKKAKHKQPTNRRNLWSKGLFIFNKFSFKKENGKEEKEVMNWTNTRTTLHGPELKEETESFKEKFSYTEVHQIGEEAKRRAEIARLQELHTLKGHLEKIIKAKGLDVEPYDHYYTV